MAATGRLFDFVANSPLAENTYVMIMSDNGAELFPTERKGKDKLVRACCCCWGGMLRVVLRIVTENELALAFDGLGWQPQCLCCACLIASDASKHLELRSYQATHPSYHPCHILLTHRPCANHPTHHPFLSCRGACPAA